MCEGLDEIDDGGERDDVGDPGLQVDGGTRKRENLRTSTHEGGLLEEE